MAIPSSVLQGNSDGLRMVSSTLFRKLLVAGWSIRVGQGGMLSF